MRKGICVVSHPRSGTHFLCKSIFNNFRTPYKHYFDLFATHKLDIEEAKSKFPKSSIVHIMRSAEYTLKSVFRMRERNGIDFSFDDFSAFLATKYIDMPRTTRHKTIICDNGNPVQQKPYSWLGKQDLTPIELWLKSNLYWFKHPQIMSIAYDALRSNPEETIHFLQDITSWSRKKVFVPCTESVGLIPLDNNGFDISEDTRGILLRAEEKFYQEIGYEPFLKAC